MIARASLLADFFNSLLIQLSGDGVSLEAASCR